MSKIRTLSAGVLCAVGLSLAGALVGPAVASATHPVWSVTHPFWALVP
jgi:hypothetical protein